VPRVSLADATRGWTPNRLAKLLCCSPDRVRDWIKSGQLGAIDLAPPGSRKPRYIILPVHLEAFERRRRVRMEPAKPVRRRRQPAGETDFYPD